MSTTTTASSVPNSYCRWNNGEYTQLENEYCHSSQSNCKGNCSGVWITATVSSTKSVIDIHCLRWKLTHMSPYRHQPLHRLRLLIIRLQLLQLLAQLPVFWVKMWIIQRDVCISFISLSWLPIFHVSSLQQPLKMLAVEWTGTVEMRQIIYHQWSILPNLMLIIWAKVPALVCMSWRGGETE